jgi:uncharacterized membrane protein YgdD (TMEM256/DUF423 family)
MTTQILILLAGLMGAAGVALLAAAAHAAPGAGLESAGQMLLFHAAAVVGAAAVSQVGYVSRTIGFVAAFAFVIGALLFSGDIAMRAYAGHRLFPMAAPTGGALLIAAWLVLSIAALLVLLRA